MFALLLLVIIYLSFISLGLPDTIIGVSIPALQTDFGIALAGGGLLSMIVISGTVVSSFLSGRLISRFGTGKVVFLSCVLTGTSLMGFGYSSHYSSLLVFAFPLGFGGGTVDVALNNYVAQNFKARHMNWLHSFWGVGATLGPVILSGSLATGDWRSGFRTISMLQLALAALLFLTLPIWKIHQTQKPHGEKPKPRGNVFTIPGVPFALAFMLFYCAVEIGVGLWGSSYLVSVKGFSAGTAARYIAFYYLGITMGRFISGFASFKLNNRQMVSLGLRATLLTLLLLPAMPPALIGAGIIIIGLGLAPIFPAMLHETPERFPKEQAETVIAYQMGFAYIGSAIIPPLLGLLYQSLSMSLFPLTLLCFTGFLLYLSRKLNRMKP
ncbi:MAG: MFS transporter [Spirochaetota bacterium]